MIELKINQELLKNLPIAKKIIYSFLDSLQEISKDFSQIHISPLIGILLGMGYVNFEPAGKKLGELYYGKIYGIDVFVDIMCKEDFINII